MKCLDSSFIIDFLFEVKEAVELFKKIKDDRIFTTSISEYEVLVGAYLEDYSTKKIEKIVSFFNAIPVLNFDTNSALMASQIASDLIKKGKTIEDEDCLIAGVIFSNDCNEIVTKNIKHFERIPELKVLSY